MSLYQQYINGECLSVWKYIHENTISSENRNDVLMVLEETMLRVKFNIELIYNLLQDNCSYVFQENPRIKPAANQEIIKLHNAIKAYGKMPLSLIYFYRVVGGVNLIQSKDIPILYQYSDPLYIEPINGVLDLLEEYNWEDKEFCTKKKESVFTIDISPDFFHKDGISGGEPYGICLTKKQEFDSYIVNTKYGDMYFVDYLRLCFEYGGFPNIKEYNTNYKNIINSLVGNLKLI